MLGSLQPWFPCIINKNFTARLFLVPLQNIETMTHLPVLVGGLWNSVVFLWTRLLCGKQNHWKTGAMFLYPSMFQNKMHFLNLTSTLYFHFCYAIKYTATTKMSSKEYIKDKIGRVNEHSHSEWRQAMIVKVMFILNKHVVKTNKQVVSVNLWFSWPMEVGLFFDLWSRSWVCTWPGSWSLRVYVPAQKCHTLWAHRHVLQVDYKLCFIFDFNLSHAYRWVLL